MDRTENLQRGIAIAPILFVVAILAVLASAIAAGSGAFNSDTSAVNDEAMAAAIIEMGEQYKYAVDRVLANGYTDTQVSFEDPSLIYALTVGGSQAANVNPNCSSDACKIFKPSGGGIVPRFLPSGAVVSNSGFSAAYFRTESMVVMPERISGIGLDTQADLVLILGKLKKSVCMKINDLLGVTNPGGKPPQVIYGNWCDSIFIGTYPSNCSYTLTNVTGKQAFCFSWSVNGYYSFARVLIAR